MDDSAAAGDDTTYQSPGSPGPEENTDSPELYEMAETLVLKGTLRGHTGMVTAIMTSINNSYTIVSSSRDKTVLVWDLIEESLTDNSGTVVTGVPRLCLTGHFPLVRDVVLSSDGQLALSGHCGNINTMSISPDGSLLAIGGEDCALMLWDISNEWKFISSLECGAIIHALCFNPHRYWVCAAAEYSVQIWDIESNSIVHELMPDTPTTMNRKLYCSSLCWSSDGNTLFAGYSDGIIMVWGISLL